MATGTGKTRCILCEKDKATLRCGGCLQEYCYKHWESHRQDLNQQLDEIEVNRDLFRQSLTQQSQQLNHQILIEEIIQWEQKSIQLIQQIAEEAKHTLMENTNEHIRQVEINLNKLTDQLRQSRQEDDFNEINLRQFQQELEQLTKELTQPLNALIREDTPLPINKISVHMSDNRLPSIPNESTLKSTIHDNTKWLPNGVTVAGGNGYGNALNQLSSPYGIYVADDQTIYVADNLNHRIISWKSGATNGQVIAGGNGRGDEMNQLSCPTDVILDREQNNLIICDPGNRRIVRWPCPDGTSGEIIISNIDCSRLTMDNNGYLYVSDMKNDEVRRWRMNGACETLVAGGNGRGNDLNQLSLPTSIYINEDHFIYVSDRNNHRVMKWIEGEKEGIIVAGSQGEGNDLTQLACPEGVVVDHFGTIYVADYNNHRIIRWSQGVTQGNIVVGEHGKGEQANQLNNPIGLAFDRQGNLYVADWNNHRIQRFDLDQNYNG